MITINEPEGRDAARGMMDGMFALAAVSGFHADIIVSANMSALLEIAREFPDSRKSITRDLQTVVAFIESGEFPSSDQPLGGASAGQQLH